MSRIEFEMVEAGPNGFGSVSKNQAALNEKDMVSIGKERAIKYDERRFWMLCDFYQLAKIQLHVAELFMPMSMFRSSLERTLGRKVSDWELIHGYAELCEQIEKIKPKPTWQEAVAEFFSEESEAKFDKFNL